MTGSAAPAPSYLVAGRYRLVRQIGRGGMGAVWLARDTLLDRDVAVKQVLSTAGMSDEESLTNRQRAMREGRLAARLSHRNAIGMHDVALDGEDPWLVMEYLPSHSVADVLRDNHTIAPIEAAQIAAQVADAIAEAHASGIIHRDIKPANILIANTGRNVGLVKITDFGISRAKDDVSLTQTGIVTGTPAYFAPEVARGDEPGEPADVYSLGATLYTMVEGRPPYGDTDNYIATLHRAANAQIDPPTRAGALEPVMLHLLEPAPAARPTMSEARDLLVQYAAGTLGTTEKVLTGLISTKPQRAVPARETIIPSNPGTNSHPPTRVAPTGTGYDPYSPSMVARPPSLVERSRDPYYGYSQPPVERSRDPYTPSPAYDPTRSGPNPYPTYYQQPPQQSSNIGLAVAIFALLVLLTAIIAVIIVMTV
ncbi:protein kinase [Gordonia sp. HY002]|uniref:serine/threonine-protein kinase n=1 Tax=Gordonia zhenghanii TaxID=2911516 RepID=UPI001EF08051|nr:serine/threonine-protein kinase [Gordonia zhenghanii]MCF8570483.1 protein kinase [Gordonia zhenghanii]MCF8602560.1 protein kinase [Gordonia zhenghanii]